METTFTTVAFRMEMPFPMTAFFPSRNGVAGVLFAELLNDRLRYAEVLAGPCWIAGDFNCCIGWMTVSDVAASVDIIRRVLAQFGLLQFCRIGWLCMEEGIWRMASPDSIKGIGIPHAEFLTNEMIESTKAESIKSCDQGKREIEEWRAAQRGKPNG